MSKLNKILLTLTVSLSILLITYSTFISSSSNPGTFGYIFKRIGEKTILKVIPQSKMNTYLTSVTNTRLSELIFVVENKKNDLMETSSPRYSFYVGILFDNLVNQSEDTKEQTLNLIKIHSDKLSQLRDVYPANGAYWLLLQQNIDTINILSDKLK